MFQKIAIATLAAIAVSTAQQKFIQPDPIDFNDHAGWQSMFDGTTLRGWDGSPDVWRAEDGAIVGESTPEKRAGTTYIMWEGGQPRNFELKADQRGIIAWRGQIVRTEQGKTPRFLSTLGAADTLKSHIIFIDEDPSMAASQGVIGLQIEGGGNVKISFRNLWLKTL